MRIHLSASQEKLLKALHECDHVVRGGAKRSFYVLRDLGLANSENAIVSLVASITPLGREWIAKKGAVIS